jgi:hypothetical protein
MLNMKAKSMEHSKTLASKGHKMQKKKKLIVKQNNKKKWEKNKKKLLNQEETGIKMMITSE